MIRITPNRCGYTGYLCRGADIVPGDVYAISTPVCDADPARGAAGLDDTLPLYPETHPVDNYLDLPVNIAGFTMQEQDIIDMSDTASPGYAEMICYAGLSVVAADGANAISKQPNNFIDLYGHIRDALLKYNVASVDDLTDISDSSIFGNRFLCYPENDDILTPALLEPVVPVTLPQIGTSTIPPAQLSLAKLMDAIASMLAYLDGLSAFLLDQIQPIVEPERFLINLNPILKRLSELEKCMKKINDLEEGVVMTTGGCNFYTKKTAPCPKT